MNDKKKGRGKNQKIKKLKKEPKDFALYDDKPIYEIGGFISKDQFKDYSNAYIKKQPFCDSQKRPIKCQLFGLGNLHKLLNQPGCHGMRAYYGLKKVGRTWMPQLMLVGVYQDGNDMIDHTLILDESLPCPLYCPDDI